MGEGGEGEKGGTRCCVPCTCVLSWPPSSVPLVTTTRCADPLLCSALLWVRGRMPHPKQGAA